MSSVVTSMVALRAFWNEVAAAARCIYQGVPILKESVATNGHKLQMIPFSSVARITIVNAHLGACSTTCTGQGAFLALYMDGRKLSALTMQQVLAKEGGLASCYRMIAYAPGIHPKTMSPHMHGKLLLPLYRIIGQLHTL
jgi:hypothetical protein